MLVKKNLVQVGIVLAACLVLAACQTTKPKVGSTTASSAEGALASGIGEQGSFEDTYAKDKASTVAPVNQVYHFGFDKYEVNSEDLASINAQASYLVAHPAAKVRIEGNADERGSREYNIALGWRRAKAVAAILEQQGVPTSQIIMLSYGKEKPVAFGHDEEAFRLNRRSELIYEAK